MQLYAAVAGLQQLAAVEKIGVSIAAICLLVFKQVNSTAEYLTHQLF
jgi:hypothetical protein